MLKIDIVSGFLGAGKTTLIKKLLDETLGNTKVVLIENEFGEIGIDSGFLKDSGIEIKEMNSGCICCSLVGDFGASLEEVMTVYAPDRILIEPSGVGKLSDVRKAVQNITDRQTLDQGKEDVQKAVLNSAVAVVDVTKCRLYIKNFGEFFTDQIRHAGTIILSRTDKVSDEKLTQCIDLLREYNKKAVIVTTPWDQLTGQAILDTMENTKDLEQDMQAMMKELRHAHEVQCACGCRHEPCHCYEHGHDHDHNHDHNHNHNHDHNHNHAHDYDHEHEHHHADEVFDGFGLETPIRYSKHELEDIMEQLEEETIYGTVLRAKGTVASVEGGWLAFDYVPGERAVRSGNADVTGKICVIGAKLKADNLAALWKKEGKG